MILNVTRMHEQPYCIFCTQCCIFHSVLDGNNGTLIRLIFTYTGALIPTILCMHAMETSSLIGVNNRMLYQSNYLEHSIRSMA